ncbi:hypothetical protein ACFL58_02985, partial [Elusimicrobiota bacterium]
MLKKIAVSLLVVSVLILFYKYSFINLESLKEPITKVLQNQTTQEASIGTIEYRLFNRIVVRKLNLGNQGNIDEIVLYFNPIELIKDRKNAVKSIYKICLIRPKIALKDDLQNVAKSTDKQGGIDAKNIIVSWKDGDLLWKNISLKKITGEASIKGSIDVKATGIFNEEVFDIKLGLKNSKKTYKGQMDFRIRGKSSDIELSSKVIAKSINDLSSSLDIKTAKWNGFTLVKATGTLNYKDSFLIMELFNKQCKISLNWKDTNNFKLNSQLKLDETVERMNGEVGLEIEANGKDIKGEISAKGIIHNSTECGDADLNIYTDYDGNVNCSGRIMPAGYILNAVISNRNEYILNLKDESGNNGLISGSIKPFSYNLNFAGWQLDKIPYFSNYFNNLSGTFSLSGKGDNRKSNILISAQNWEIEDVSPMSFKMQIYKNNQDWFFEADSLDDEYKLSGKYLNENEWEMKAKVSNMNIQKFVKWFKIKESISGNVSGDLSYKSISEGHININAEDLLYGKYYFGEIVKINIELNKNNLSINNVFMGSQTGSVSGKGRVGLVSGKNNCNLSLVFKNYELDNKVLNGKITAIGDLKAENIREFNGVLNA